MKAQTLWVPFAVLNTRSHSVNTRLMWLLLGGQPPASLAVAADRRLRKWSGLEPETVARACERLARAPLGPIYTQRQPSCAAIPVPLLTDGAIPPGARVLYGQLQEVPGFARPAGSFTYSLLSHLTGRSDDTLRKAAAELVAHGWLTIAQVNRKAPLSFTLRDPVGARLRARIASVRRKVRGAQYRGQTLLGEWLNAVVALDEYQENASPDFLRNPFTGELMDLDRYYPSAAVAFEHDETDLSIFEDTVKQVGRDVMKAFLCKTQGIQLVTVRPEELTLKRLEEKIPEGLPRRDLTGLRPLVAALEELATDYRERTAEERARRAPPGGRRSPGRSARPGRGKQAPAPSP